jgi:U3 small nucleolar RNA-associated protein 12
MQKTYLRYVASPGPPLGVVASSRAAAVLVSATHLLVPAWDAAVLWDTQRAVALLRFEPRPDKQDGACAGRPALTRRGSNAIAGEVTALASSSSVVVLGRFTGRVDLYDSDASGPPRASLTGHRSAVCCARFNAEGSRLATGALDTTILVLDPTVDAVLFALRGHKDQVTDLVFLSGGESRLMSSSKDTMIKLWDLESEYFPFGRMRASAR